MSYSPRLARRLVAIIVLVTLLLTATPALGIPRSAVMARAQRWTDAVIPYSQTGWADAAGVAVGSPSLGWRRDCSGFVSQAWQTAKPGYSTRTLQNVATQITKDALLPGDALVSYNNHALLFGGWANANRTEYWAYEMSSSQSSRTGDGTVVRKTPYPYWPGNSADSYRFYRLNTITEDQDYSQSIVSVEGASRYETAVAASHVAFADGEAPVVVVASGVDWPDALAASALAGAVGGPVLLTRPDSLPDAVAQEIVRLGAREALVAGGEAAVSDDVMDALKALPGVSVARIAGADRYQTSRSIAEETVRRLGDRFAGRVIVATGEGFADALAAAPLAAKGGWPIVLTPGTALSGETTAALQASNVTSALIVGGEGAVAPGVEAALETALGIDSVERIAGEDRYATALAIAAFGVAEANLSYGSVAIATGESFPDALAGGVMASRLGTVLLLTRGSTLPSVVAIVLAKNVDTVGKPHVLGGEAVVKPPVRQAIALALTQW